MIHFVFYGEAIGKGRPRVSRRGGYVHTYTPERTRRFEENIKFEYLAHSCERPYTRDKSLYADIKIGVGIPRSYSKKDRENAINGILRPSKKPDIDNIIKSIMDALNGLAYEDDSQIVQIHAIKEYVQEPFVEVQIGEVGEL